MEIDRRIVSDQPLSYKLKLIAQKDFLDYYYGPFIDVPVETAVCPDEKKEIELLKLQMANIGKYKKEAESATDKIYNSKKKIEPEKIRVYQERVRKFIKKSYETMWGIHETMQKYGIKFAQLGDMKKDKMFKTNNYDPEEINVGRAHQIFFNNLKLIGHRARELLGVDVVEARALFNRAGTTR